MSALNRLGLAQDTSTAEAVSSDQSQTRDAFGFKWAKRDTYEADAVQDMTRTWLFNRYCGGEPERLAHWLSREKDYFRCRLWSGQRRTTLFHEHLDSNDYRGDISTLSTWRGSDSATPIRPVTFFRPI